MALRARCTVLVLVAICAVGCSSPPLTPTAPSVTTPSSLDALVGAWRSGSGTTGNSVGLPAECSQINYEITPGADPGSATVQFSGTCAGVTATGTGRGRLGGTTLHWSADGTATTRGITCPFSFTDSTATPEGGNLRVTYSGTICGIPVSGSQLLTRR